MHVVKYQFLFWSISDYVIGERIDDQPEEKKGKKRDRMIHVVRRRESNRNSSRSPSMTEIPLTIVHRHMEQPWFPTASNLVVGRKAEVNRIRRSRETLSKITTMLITSVNDLPRHVQKCILIKKISFDPTPVFNGRLPIHVLPETQPL